MGKDRGRTRIGQAHSPVHFAIREAMNRTAASTSESVKPAFFVATISAAILNIRAGNESAGSSFNCSLALITLASLVKRLMLSEPGAPTKTDSGGAPLYSFLGWKACRPTTVDTFSLASIAFLFKTRANFSALSSKAFDLERKSRTHSELEVTTLGGRSRRYVRSPCRSASRMNAPPRSKA